MKLLQKTDSSLMPYLIPTDTKAFIFTDKTRQAIEEWYGTTEMIWQKPTLYYDSGKTSYGFQENYVLGLFLCIVSCQISFSIKTHSQLILSFLRRKLYKNGNFTEISCE